jgi:hypothetical protein
VEDIREYIKRGSSTDRPVRSESTTEDSKIDGSISDICELQRTSLQNASESPEKQQKGLCQYTAWKELRLLNFSLYEGFFQSPKKDHSILHLYSSSI